MKVDISFDEEKAGMLSKEKFAVVKAKFHLTEEEEHILQDNKLRNYIIVETGADARFPKEPEDRYHLRGSNILHGEFTYGFDNKIEAVLFSQKVKPAIEQLKELMEVSNAFGDDVSFEV